MPFYVDLGLLRSPGFSQWVGSREYYQGCDKIPNGVDYRSTSYARGLPNAVSFAVLGMFALIV